MEPLRDATLLSVSRLPPRPFTSITFYSRHFARILVFTCVTHTDFPSRRHRAVRAPHSREASLERARLTSRRLNELRSGQRDHFHGSLSSPFSVRFRRRVLPLLAPSDKSLSSSLLYNFFLVKSEASNPITFYPSLSSNWVICSISLPFSLCPSCFTVPSPAP